LRETPLLGLGVHLVLTMGSPISAPETISSVTDKEGNFFKYSSLVENLPKLNINEVKAEWRAQIEAFIKASGRKPDHLDSHHHSSFFTPELFRTMLELAKEYDCPIRNPIAYGDNPTAGMPAVANPMADHAPRLMKEFSAISTDTIFVNISGVTAYHVFKSEGVYVVNLTVLDDAGNSDWDTMTVTVEKKSSSILGSNAILIGGIAVVVVIALVAILLLRKRKGKSTPDMSDSFVFTVPPE